MVAARSREDRTGGCSIVTDPFDDLPSYNEPLESQLPKPRVGEKKLIKKGLLSLSRDPSTGAITDAGITKSAKKAAKKAKKAAKRAKKLGKAKSFSGKAGKLPADLRAQYQEQLFDPDPRKRDAAWMRLTGIKEEVGQ